MDLQLWAGASEGRDRAPLDRLWQNHHFVSSEDDNTSYPFIRPVNHAYYFHTPFPEQYSRRLPAARPVKTASLRPRLRRWPASLRRAPHLGTRPIFYGPRRIAHTH